jgi:predicted permease
VAGRDFSSQDNLSSPRVVIINEEMARRFWPGDYPIGKQFHYGDDEVMAQIIGVAKNVKYRTIGEEQTPHMYVPLLQDYSPSMTLLVRTAGKPDQMTGALQQEIQALDKEVQGFFARTMEEHIGFSLLPARLAATLLAAFGLLALALASLGIYGAISYSVSQRTRELGIRQALGAQAGDIFKLVVGQAFKLTIAGVAVGLVAAYLLTRFLSSLLFGLSATDPATFALVSLLLLGVALVACAVPARRATKVDPMTALRHE